MSRLQFVTCVLLMTAVPAAQAQYGAETNMVTVNVDAITQIGVTGGVVSFDVTEALAVAGQNSMTVTNSSTQLQWATNSGSQKITVQTSLGTQMFALRLVASSPTAGSAAPEVTVSTVAADLLLNIGRSLGSCSLQYTAEALASLGTGTDIHTITFTVTTQ